MQVKEFSSQLFNNPKEASTFMSFLLGYSFKKPNYEKVILSFYENLSMELKDEKTFAPVFLKYFSQFLVNDESLTYFKQFSKFWKLSDLELIIEKNPTSDLKKENREYKNSRELTQACIKLLRSKDLKVLTNFLKNNYTNIEKLLEKDKIKFQINFTKENIFKDLLIRNPKYFDEFCQKYEFNQSDILNQIIKNNTYESVLPTLQDETFNNLFPLISTEIIEILLDKNDSLKYKHKDNKINNILDLFCESVIQKKVNNAYYLFKNFSMDINRQLKDSVSQNADLLNIDDLKTYQKENYCQWGPTFKSSSPERLEKSFESFQEFFNIMKLQNKLDSDLSVPNLSKKIKL